MVNIVFVLDNSASMNQRSCLGTTYLDLAKSAIDSFLKIRNRDPANRLKDRYMLVTCDDGPSGVKAAWRESMEVFTEQVRSLKARGSGDIGRALREAFDMLNMYRLQSNADSFGMGRNPFYSEPAVVLLVTDGSVLTTSGPSASNELAINSTFPGSELYKDPFRWDQRMFCLLLRVSGVAQGVVPNTPIFNIDSNRLALLCEATGGKAYLITSQKVMVQMIESIVQKLQHGVVVQLRKVPQPQEVALQGGPPLLSNSVPPYNSMEGDYKMPMNGPHPVENGTAYARNGMLTFGPRPKGGLGPSGGTTLGSLVTPPAPPQISSSTAPALPPLAPLVVPTSTIPPAWHCVRRMIIIKAVNKNHNSSWPIPESFWVDSNLQTLQSRDAHPTLWFSCVSTEPHTLEILPFDKYELEPSPLSQHILEMKDPQCCWQVFVAGSSPNSEYGFPFGYIKAGSNLQSVNLIVLPYNYPVLVPLLEELQKDLKGKMSPRWRQKFDNYLSSIPFYYLNPLRDALRRMGVPHVMAENVDWAFHPFLGSQLKNLKIQAKNEAERLLSLVGNTRPVEIPNVPLKIPNHNTELSIDYRKLLLKHSVTLASTSRDNIHSCTNIRLSNNDFSLTPRPLPRAVRGVRMRPFHNPFDIDRKNILVQLLKMRINLFSGSGGGSSACRLQDEDMRHNVAIAEMGNFQRKLDACPPLRDVDNSTVRHHAFGNPFKFHSDQTTRGTAFAVDEADITETSASSGSSTMRKRPMERRFQAGRKRARLEPSSSLSTHKDLGMTSELNNLLQPSNPSHLIRNPPPPPARMPVGSIPTDGSQGSAVRRKVPITPLTSPVPRSVTPAAVAPSLVPSGDTETSRRAVANSISKTLRALKGYHNNKAVTSRMDTRQDGSSSYINSAIKSALLDQPVLGKSANAPLQTSTVSSMVNNTSAETVVLPKHSHTCQSLMVKTSLPSTLPRPKLDLNDIRVQAWRLIRQKKLGSMDLEVFLSGIEPEATRRAAIQDLLKEAARFRRSAAIVHLRRLAKG